MNPEMMKEALTRRKANGLDITILLSPPEGMEQDEADEAKELDMAPPAEELGEEQDQKDMAMGKMGADMQVMPDNSMLPQDEEAQKKALIQKELGKLGRGTMASKMKY